MYSDKKPRLFLIDAYAIIYRAYFAFSRTPISNSKGQNTSAVFGFINTLQELLKKEKPDHIAVAFDAPSLTLRSEMFEAYKANREATPEDIRWAVPYCKDILQAMGIPIYILEGYEADDIIGTLAIQAAAQDLEVYMFTPDKDYAQIVRPNIFMYRPSLAGKPSEIWGVSEVCEKFQVKSPSQVIDLLALWGDASDNIPGIPGVGEKTAQKLIAEYESLENIIQHAHAIKGKVGENIKQFQEQGILSKQLATIITDVPLQLDYDATKIGGMDKAKLQQLFEELEFKNLAKRFFTEETIPEQLATETEPVASSLKTLQDVPHQYVWVNTPEALEKLIHALHQSTVFSFDTETTDLEELDAELVCVTFCLKPGEVFCVPFAVDFEEAKIKINAFASIFIDETKTLVAQNFKYDLKVLHKYGVVVKNQLFDTMLAHYLLNPEGSHGLDALAQKYLSYAPIPIEQLIGKKGKNQMSMRLVDKETLLDYACEDADITFQLYEKLQVELLDKPALHKIFTQIENPLVFVLADMELAGVYVDTAFLKKYSSELETSIQEIPEQIFNYCPFPFNLDSPKQLGQVLFETLQIGGAKIKKTKTGQYATSEEELQKYHKEHAIVPLILSYRLIKKLKSTYVDALPQLIHHTTGRIHTSLMQAVTATGRLSSTKPNLQNIPVKTEQGRYIRKAFSAKNQDFLMMSADYSQVELRIMAALAQDKNMIDAFVLNQDIHKNTAAKIYHVPLQEVTFEQRRNAKAVNFGIIYGQTAFGLAESLAIARSEAKEIIENYFIEYPAVQQYMADVVAQAKKLGYCETLLGRRRYLPDIHSANQFVRAFAERNAINAPIQGTAADIIKLAMLHVQAFLHQNKCKTTMLLQVHDELLFEVHAQEKDWLMQEIKQIMEQCFDLPSVPLKVDISTGLDWLEAH